MHDDMSDDAPVEVPSPRSTYFAALPRHEIGAELLARVDAYERRCEDTGIRRLWEQSYRAYYGLDEDGTFHKSSAVEFGGEDGELTLVKVNQYRSVARSLLTITTQNRPHYETRATNTDHASLAQNDIARGVLEYYLREQRIEAKLKGAVERSIVFGEGFLAITWDPTAGEMVQPGDDEIAEYEAAMQSAAAMGAEPPPEPGPRRAGDLEVRVFAPMDVIRDWRREASEHDWYILRRTVNKYDLAAQFPELADRIVEKTPDEEEGRKRVSQRSASTAAGSVESDDVYLYEFFHASTDAVPDGRLVVFLDDELVLFDGALPYDALPVYRMAPAEFMGSAFGYSDGYDLLSLQQLIDAMVSVVATNYDAHGVQNVVEEQGTEVDDEMISSGMRRWKIPRGAMPPQGVVLTKLPDGITDFIRTLIGWVETLSGVNAVARGNPGETLGKGAPAQALALVQAMAIQHTSGLQAGYATLIEDGGTGILNVLKRYADRPRMALIAGKRGRHQLQAFSSDDIRNVARVVVEPGNPILRTNEGRMEIVRLLLEIQQQTGVQIIESVEQVISVINTGRIEPFTDGPMSEQQCIRLENELLAQGPTTFVTQIVNPSTGMTEPLESVEGVQVVATDKHTFHIREHKAVLASPEARGNPAVVKAVLAHIMEHMRTRRSVDPELLAIIGEPPPPPDPAAAILATTPAEAGPSASTGDPRAVADVAGGNGVQRPEPPTNPLTGEPAPMPQ